MSDRTLPEIPSDIADYLASKLTARSERCPYFRLVLDPVGAPVPRMWASDLAAVKRAVSDLRDSHIKEITQGGLVELGDQQQGPRSELLRDVVWAPEGKRGMIQLTKISQQECRHEVIRRIAKELLEVRQKWMPVLERLALAKEVLITRVEAAAKKEAEAIAAIPKHRLEARPKVERMVVESCKDGLDEWEKRFVPDQVARILYHPIKYEEGEAVSPVGVAAYCKAVTGSDNLREGSVYWWNAKREESQIQQDLAKLLPVEPVGRELATKTAKEIAQGLRDQFLAKMVEKLCSAECEDRISTIETIRERVDQGRLAATLVVRLSDGGEFRLETNSVIKFGPRSGQPFAQWPTRFTAVKPAGADLALAVVAEADVAALLAAPVASSDDVDADATVQKNKKTKR